MSVELLPNGVACHSDCTYCYQSPLRDANNTNPLGGYDIDKMIEQGLSISTNLTLFGGESLLLDKKDAEKVFAASVKAGGHASVQTNGDLIDPEWIELFRQYNVGVGVSIDGPGKLNSLRPARGTGDWKTPTQKTLDNLVHLRNAGISTSIISTLHKMNGGENLDTFMDWGLWLANIGITHLNLHPLETESWLIREKYALSEEEEIRDILRLAKWLKTQKHISWTPFAAFKRILTGDSANVDCVFHHCLHARTKLQLYDGGTVEIRDVVDGRKPVVLRGMSEDGTIVPVTVTNWLKSSSPGQSWVRIGLHGSGSMTLTPDHLVWTRQGWKRADKLTTEDEIPSALLGSDDMIHGTLLGDGHVTRSHSRSSQLSVLHSSKQREWIEAKAAHFGKSKLYTSEHDEYESSFSTVPCLSFRASIDRKWRAMFHPDGGDKIFIPPPSDRALAVWFMDDGNWSRTWHVGDGRASIATHSFRTQSEQLYAWALEEFGDGVRVDKKGVLHFARGARDSLFNRIHTYVPPYMQYKLPERWRGKYDGWIETRVPQWRRVASINTKTPKGAGKDTRYCVEVDHPTHRFFTSQGLVKNCDPLTTPAVQGVMGDASMSNCGRTMKEGVLWQKASGMGFERYLALYQTPQSVGGCKDCRYFMVCGGMCYDDQTEVLTDSGFKLFKDVNIETDMIASMDPESGILTYRKATASQKFAYDGDMLHFSGASLDLAVTPEHRMLVFSGNRFAARQPGLRVSQREIPHFIPADDVKPGGTYLRKDAVWTGATEEKIVLPDLVDRSVRGAHTSKAAEIGTVDARAFAEFMGWYISEGCTYTSAYANRPNSTRYDISISQKDAEAADRILDSVVCMGLSGRIQKCKDGVHQIRLTSKQLGLYLLDSVGRGSHLKRVPREIKDLGPGLIRTFLYTLFEGDGHIRNGKLYSFETTSRGLADDIQELLLKVGLSSSVSLRDMDRVRKRRAGYSTAFSANYQQYVISVNHTRLRPELKSAAVRVPYTGFVYDLTVPPNGTLFVRRNGKVVWSSNCPGEGEIDSSTPDWRNRSSHCAMYKALFLHYEMELLEDGIIPATLNPARKEAESRMIQMFRNGRRPSSIHTLFFETQAKKPCAGCSDSTDDDHGDSHGDHTDMEGISGIQGTSGVQPHGDIPHGDDPHGDSHGDSYAN